MREHRFELARLRFNSCPPEDRALKMTPFKPLRTMLIGIGLIATQAMAIDVPPPPAPTAPNAVNIGWLVFVPATLTVPAGTTVTWTNVDDSNHMVKFPDQKSARLDKGSTYSRTFTTAGEYPYMCGIHGPRMTGKIIVK
jgi:plastocyanin